MDHLRNLFSLAQKELDSTLNLGYKELGEYEKKLLFLQYSGRCPEKVQHLSRDSFLMAPAISSPILAILTTQNKYKAAKVLLLDSGTAGELRRPLSAINQYLVTVTPAKAISDPIKWLQGVGIVVMAATDSNITYFMNECLKRDILVFFIDEQLNGPSEIMKFGPQNRNWVILRPLGTCFRRISKNASFETAIIIAGSQEVKSILGLAMSAFKMIPSLAGIMLIRTWFGGQGAEARSRLEHEIKSRYSKISAFLSRKALYTELRGTVAVIDEPRSNDLPSFKADELDLLDDSLILSFQYASKLQKPKL